MKNINLILTFFICHGAVTQVSAQSTCHSSSALVANPLSADLVKACDQVATDPTGCENLGAQKDSKKSFQDIADADKTKHKVIMARNDPNSRTSNSVTYKFDAQKLNPGESIYLWVPSDLQTRGTEFVILGHRQNPATNKGMTEGSKYDNEPGLTSVQVYDDSFPEGQKWRSWNGQASGKDGAKFAEPANTFELESLYQWMKLGHNAVGGKGGGSNKELKPKLVRLMSVGTDTVEISELTLKTNTTEPDQYTQHSMTPGTKFGTRKTGDGYELGGGQENEGIFPNALDLGTHGAAPTNLPKGWTFKNGQLSIPLPAGYVLTGLEFAGGDAHTDKIKNDDGGWGTKGWARLHMDIQKYGQRIETLMSKENVPPEGFLNASPVRCGRVIGEGEQLVIRSTGDITHMAGIRIGLKKP